LLLLPLPARSRNVPLHLFLLLYASPPPVGLLSIDLASRDARLLVGTHTQRLICCEFPGKMRQGLKVVKVKFAWCVDGRPNEPRG
jgi:hypothetical protein